MIDAYAAKHPETVSAAEADTRMDQDRQDDPAREDRLGGVRRREEASGQGTEVLPGMGVHEVVEGEPGEAVVRSSLPLDPEPYCDPHFTDSDRHNGNLMLPGDRFLPRAGFEPNRDFYPVLHPTDERMLNA